MLKAHRQKAVENHVNGAVWAFDYDKMFCVLMENEICRKVCEKNKYNSWMNLIGQYCVQGLKDEKSCWREIISSNSVFNE